MEGLVHFTSIPIIQRLLMLDVAFYGMGIADIISGVDVGNARGIIKAYSALGTSHFIQRFLEQVGGPKRTISTSFGHAVYVYELESIVVEMHFDSRPFESIAPIPFTDVGNLYVTRKGLCALSRVEDHAPVWSLVENCLFKRCNINPRTLMDTNIYENIRRLYSNGWTIENMDIKIVKGDGEDCPICRNTFTGEMVRTVCNHLYCIKCWSKHWNHTVDSVDNTTFRFSLGNSPTKVSCPMCRQEMEAWRCTPLVESRAVA